MFSNAAVVHCAVLCIHYVIMPCTDLCVIRTGAVFFIFSIFSFHCVVIYSDVDPWMSSFPELGHNWDRLPVKNHVLGGSNGKILSYSCLMSR